MRLLLDAKILLDCLVLENSGLPRRGKDASEQILDQCDRGLYQGLVAWHTLPIISYYYGRQKCFSWSIPPSLEFIHGIGSL